MVAGLTGSYEITRAFASVGCRVIMTSRKEEQGKEAIETIKKETPDAQLEWIMCDNGNLKQVQEVFGKIRDKEERLDLVCLLDGFTDDEVDT